MVPRYSPTRLGCCPSACSQVLGHRMLGQKRFWLNWSGETGPESGVLSTIIHCIGGLLRRVSRPETWALGLEQVLWASSPFRLSQSVLLSPVWRTVLVHLQGPHFPAPPGLLGVKSYEPVTAIVPKLRSPNTP